MVDPRAPILARMAGMTGVAGVLAQTASQGVDDSTLVVLAVIAAVPLVLSAWWSRQARDEAAGANKAVNNVGPGEPSLRERIDSIAEHVGDARDDLARLGRKIDRHLSWHQVQTEQGDRAAGPPMGALDQRGTHTHMRHDDPPGVL